ACSLDDRDRTQALLGKSPNQSIPGPDDGLTQVGNFAHQARGLKVYNKSVNDLPLNVLGSDLALARPASESRKAIAQPSVLRLIEYGRPAFAELNRRCLKHRPKT